MTTYKQPEKDKSRILLWNHAVESLTSLRDSNRILNTTYMEHLWLYCQQQLNEKLDIEAFIQWKQYADICYQTKKPEELKIAFFCGNEPENDVKHLLGLGVRIENIYAFECDSSLFNQAVKSLHNTYPLLKIYALFLSYRYYPFIYLLKTKTAHIQKTSSVLSMYAMKYLCM